MPELTSTADAVKIGDAALAAIEQFVSLPANSPFKTDIELLKQHHQAFLCSKNFTDIYGDADLRPFMRRQIGALDFSKRVVLLDRAGNLSNFKEHLAYFKDAGVSPASPMEDYDSLGTDGQHHTRLLFEFYVASGISIHSGLPVQLAGGKDDSQNNPDVSIPGNGIEGVACKMVKCNNYVTILDRLMGGATQIEKSTCQSGIVALDVRTCIDHELLVPKSGDSYRTFKNEADAIVAEDATFQEIGEKLLETMDQETHPEAYRDRTKRSGFIIAAQGFSIIETEHGPVPVNMNKARFVPVIFYEGEVDLTAIYQQEIDIARWIATTPPVQI